MWLSSLVLLFSEDFSFQTFKKLAPLALKVATELKKQNLERFVTQHIAVTVNNGHILISRHKILQRVCPSSFSPHNILSQKFLSTALILEEWHLMLQTMKK